MGSFFNGALAGVSPAQRQVSGAVLGWVFSQFPPQGRYFHQPRLTGADGDGSAFLSIVTGEAEDRAETSVKEHQGRACHTQISRFKCVHGIYIPDSGLWE